MVKETVGMTNEQPGSQVRKHYYRDQYVVIAPRRMRRPARSDRRTVSSRKHSLHHSIEDTPSLLEIPDEKSGDWHVKVVPNAYPALEPSGEHPHGSQEVVLETPRLDVPFHKLSVTDIERVLYAYQHRIATLRGQFRYVSVFKNHGSMAGATLDHTHSQIIATDTVPPEVATDRDALTQYQYIHKTSVLCDVIRHEMTENRRVVIPSRHTTTICPYASQFPLEAWIIPHRQCHSITDLSPDEMYSVADHLKGVTVALGSSDIDFNYHLMENAPDAFNHFYIKVTPRLAPYGGFELNTGMHINPVSPEYASFWYQKHIKAPHAV